VIFITEHLKIKNFKSIKELEINNLGIINSFCGKNNIGKTTIFEALYAKKYFLGRVFNKDSYDQVKYSFDQNYNGLTNKIQRVINLIFQDIEEKVVFGDIIYLKELTNNTIEQNTKSVKNDSDVIDSLRNIIYHHIINKRPTFRYVSAKRNIQEYSKIDLNEKFASNGIGIINKLFNLRNQLPNSEKYNKFMRIYNAFESI
jgi:AAA15 family ATPase/GTPase